MKAVLTVIGIVVALLSLPADITGQLLHERSYLFESEISSMPASNTITDILVFEDTVWLGTGAGLSRTRDEGLTFETFNRMDGLGQGSVSALAVSDDVIWVATGFDTTTEFGQFQAGGGLAYSLDDGLTWSFVPQPGATNVQNITFDIALRRDEAWITSFGGGLRKTPDLGLNWEIVTPDSFIFDPVANLNHRVFAVTAVDSVLWVGSALGVNRSNDGGSTWTNFNHQNQPNPLSGNFVVAIGHQAYDDKEIIWAATRETTVESGDTTEFRGVSWSDDQGFNWKTALRGKTVHNFGFDGAAVYAAAEDGVYKSVDGGETWARFPPIENPTGTRRILSDEVFSAGVSQGSMLWVGTRNGLGKTGDNGVSWQVIQVFESTGQEGSPRTYAYPNPFSPNLHNRLNGRGHVRFQYNTEAATRVTLRVFDYGMQLVRTVVEDGGRPGSSDLYEVWDGTDTHGRPVDGGVYFYKLELEGEGTFWGKLILLR